MCDTTIDDYRWLVGEEAEGLLDHLAETGVDPLPVAKRLRRQLSPQRARLVLEQLQLRRRAVKKFAAAGRMFFTARALQQASDEVIASYKAGRFVAQSRVADLCCGIGGDLLALAARQTSGPAPPITQDAITQDAITQDAITQGVDKDPVMHLLAAANGRAAATQVQLATADATSWNLAAIDAWHIDPDRRSGDRRKTSIAMYQPGLADLRRLLAANPHAAVKLAPAGDPPEDWQADAELEWISRGRECRQLVAWFGALADQRPDGGRGTRRATWLGNAPDQHSHLVGLPHESMETAAGVGRYLVEPDPAVLAAHLTGSVAARYDLKALAPGVAYLTADKPTAHRLLACFEVTDVLPFDLRRLKRLLKDRGIGHLEVKQRSLSEDPAAIARRLRVPGDRSATLLLAPLDRSVTAILARRISYDALLAPS